MLCLGSAKNHLIVVPDADPEVTVSGVVASFTGCAGQRCMAASLLVAGDVTPCSRPVERAALETGKQVGKSSTCIGQASRYIDEAKTRRWIPVDGRGKKAAGDCHWGITVIDGVTPDMLAWQDEIFGASAQRGTRELGGGRHANKHPCRSNARACARPAAPSPDAHSVRGSRHSGR
jgi:malonate-semialdehyde dehydrogenase (acetylating)/methylmalonate-semialdehyde dehydrogenase